MRSRRHSRRWTNATHAGGWTRLHAHTSARCSVRSENCRRRSDFGVRRQSRRFESGAHGRRTPKCYDPRSRERYRSRCNHRGPMRKLKLQMQITVDGFVAGPQGQLDWMTWDMDEELIAFITHLTDSSDTILLGRKMTEGFITSWEQVITKPDSAEYSFARKMVGMPKVVFS